MSLSRYDSRTQALHQTGYRLTPQRAAICRYLATSRGHPSLGEVYERVRVPFPAVSLATVYNTLTVLRDLGEIIEIPGAAEGLRYETYLHPHINLICLRCGRIRDLASDSLAAVQEAMRNDSHFDLRGLRVDGFGLCDACRFAEESESHD